MLRVLKNYVGQPPFGISAFYPSALLIAILANSVGCGPSNAYRTVKVEGTVTFEDGSSTQGLQLMFYPQTAPIDPKTHPRPGIANLDANGAIVQVTTYDLGDGVIPGKHKVVVRSDGSGKASTRNIPKEYRSAKNTPIEIDTADIPLSISIAKLK